MNSHLNELKLKQSNIKMKQGKNQLNPLTSKLKSFLHDKPAIS